MGLTPTREDRQPKTAVLGTVCLLMGVVGVATGVPEDSAVSSWSIVLLGVVWAGGGYLTGRAIDVFTAAVLTVVGGLFLVALDWSTTVTVSSAFFGFLFGLCFSLGCLVAAVAVPTGAVYDDRELWKLPVSVLAVGAVVSLVGFTVL